MNPTKILKFSFLTIAVLIINACGDPEPEELPKLNVENIGNVSEGDSGNTPATFNITLSEASGEEVTVEYKVRGITATKDEDFIEKSGLLTFNAGEIIQSITIEILTDTLREVNETVVLTIFNPTNAEIESGSGQLIIANDDANIVISPAGYTTPTSYPGMSLAWADEFNGTSVNQNDWNFEIGNGCPNVCGWGNNELEYYTDREDNVYISGGNLVIEAREESYNGYDYTSTRMTTEGKQEHQYGRIDIRAILPEGQGIWPALWMLGDDFRTTGWAACGEIDIMELVGHEPEEVHGTVHWDLWPNNQYKGTGYRLPTNAKFSEEYHVFTLLWEENKIEWLVDDVKYFEVTDATVGSSNYPYNHPFFFLFNIAVGGDWPGNPDATAVFPQRMIVDYIRVFQ